MRHKFIIPVVLSLFFAACTTNQPRYRIAVSQCQDDAWRQKMNEEMQRELLLHPDMQLYTRIAYGDNRLQCAQIDSFIRERVDLLIVSPNEAEAVKPAVTRAYQAGIPVIVADRRVSGDEWTAFIGGDNYRVGQLMAEWIQREQSAAGKQSSAPFIVLEVKGLEGSTPAILRHKGMSEELERRQANVIIRTVMGRWYQEDAYTAVSDYLRTHGRVDAIVAQNDLMAIGAAKAVRESERGATKGEGETGIPIMGVDGIQPGLQAIADSVIACSATYSSRGDMVIQTAAQILAGEPFVRDTVLETTLIDADGARAMLMQYHERVHDLETLEIVQLRSDAQWKQMKQGELALIIVIVFVLLLFVAALAMLLYLLRRTQKEIKRDILPQLEEVQEAIQLSHRDVAFAERLKQIVDDHLTDPNLNVEFLSSMLQLSRTQVFRRIKAIMGKGALEYIRERRLLRADELLRTTDITVQQVALELCFSSPGYFTKCYKEFFGRLPSEVGLK